MAFKKVVHSEKKTRSGRWLNVVEMEEGEGEVFLEGRFLQWLECYLEQCISDTGSMWESAARHESFGTQRNNYLQGWDASGNE